MNSTTNYSIQEIYIIQYILGKIILKQQYYMLAVKFKMNFRTRCTLTNKPRLFWSSLAPLLTVVTPCLFIHYLNVLLFWEFLQSLSFALIVHYFVPLYMMHSNCSIPNLYNKYDRIYSTCTCLFLCFNSTVCFPVQSHIFCQSVFNSAKQRLLWRNAKIFSHDISKNSCLHTGFTDWLVESHCNRTATTVTSKKYLLLATILIYLYYCLTIYPSFISIFM